MALATRPKPTVQHKKRRAQHHRQSKLYLKPYWPYLPMLAIVGLGYAANRFWPSGGIFGNQLEGPQPAARIQVLAGNQSAWLLAAVLIITAAAFAFFVVRHWYRFHRLINRGEAFVSRHPWLDITAVIIFTAGFVLTRASILNR